MEIEFPELEMRIGIHTGDIVGGVIGTEVIRYDIYGQDVIIANKMESQGKKGKINVSETTKGLLESNYKDLIFEKNNILQVEGRSIQMYFVEKV